MSTGRMSTGPMRLALPLVDAPQILLDVPPDFHQVPLAAATEGRTAAQLRVLGSLGLSDPAQREAVSLYLEALAIRLGSGNVVGTAFCAVRLAGHASTATLTVALHATHTTDASLAAMGAAEAMRRDGRHDRVELEALGGRPVVTAVSMRSARTGDTPSGVPGESLREISVVVPVQGQQHAVMLTLSTPCLDDWDTYREVVLEICRSVRVDASQRS